jgi:Ca2+-binding RTX toxin-like protein
MSVTDNADLDGTVQGTLGSDLIDESYTGDPQGDRVDSHDAILPGAGPEDDIIYGFDGNDVINAGSGDDLAYGGDGNDVVFGSNGDDTLYGDAGNDEMKGGPGTDTSYGGTGDDTFINDTGENDEQYGGDDSDTFLAGDNGDLMDGGAGGVDNDTLDLRGAPPYRIEDLVEDSNNNGFNGTVVYLDADGNPTGESFTFVEIENILEDPQTGLDGTVEGTDGDDLIDIGYTGDPEGDRVDNGDNIFPDRGDDDDIIEGRGGNDTIVAGEGDDDVYGGDGNDTVGGNDGDDTLSGDDGDDSLTGGDGSDTLFGGDGNDTIDSSDGGVGLFDNPYPPLPTDPDVMNDRDVVFGGAGDDTIRTGDDRDTIDGGTGNDTIDAGIDDDSVSGGDGNDVIVGGEGNDVIDGGTGNDTIYGGLSPVFPDSLNIPDDTDLVPDNGLDTISGGAGDDTIYGLDDNDRILGGMGDDFLDGGIDDDVVTGGSGDDTIIGGQGDDRLSGGNDRDTFQYRAGDGSDLVVGGSGGDDFDTLDLSTLPLGSFRIVDRVTDSDGNGFDGTVELLDADGNVTDTIKFQNIEEIVPCFTPGTLIATPRGEKPVEELQVGDRVITRDNGIQEIRWVGAKAMTGRELIGSPHLRPVVVKAGALGNGLPERDMMLSPNHRVLVANAKTQLYFDESEVLAAVKHLVGTDGVYELDVMSTTYIHFMFDRHEVVLSNGAWTESFQPGDMSLKGVGNAQRTEILELFPELATREGIDGYQAARKTLKKHEARLLVR